MKPSSTLNTYLFRVFLRNMVAMTAFLWGVIYMFETLELLRRASKRGDVPWAMVLKMSFLKLPDTGLTIFSFVILFSAMYTFWRLNRRNELTVMRAAGFSVWQFLAPVIGVAAVTGLLIISLGNPFSAVLLGRFKLLEARYLTHQRSQIALFDRGLWLRQLQDDDSYVILHADTIKMPDWQLRNVLTIYFDADDSFVRRVDAESATLTANAWQLRDAYVNVPGQPVVRMAGLELPTDLTSQKIEESFSSPETMSVWRLPAFIRTVEATGFDATRLRLHFNSLLAQPVLFAAMILLAAAVSLQPPRFRSTLTLLMAGIFIGFGAFFLSSFLQALGASHQIPILLAAWSPALVMAMLGTAAILALEDG